MKMNKQVKKISIVILFALSLFGLRSAWVAYFSYDRHQPVVKDGELDISQWDFEDRGILTLAGEWHLYPGEFLQDVSDLKRVKGRTPIQVPGDWSPVLNEETEEPYGYGTYYLKLQLTPEKAYKLYVSSVRSASEVYVNGQLIGQSGTVGTNREETFARNVPYTTTSFKPNEKGEVHLFVQAANFEDPRASGIVRSIKIGLRDDVISDLNLSALLQFLTSTIFLLHALFGLIIYFIGIRERRLIFFSLSLVILAYINVTYGDEKVLLQYVTIDYPWTLRLAFATALLLSLFLSHTLRKQIDELSEKLLPVLSMIHGLVLLAVLFVPLEYLPLVGDVNSLVIGITGIIMIVALFQSADYLFQSLAFTLATVAIVHQFGWYTYLTAKGIKVVHYPFDLITAIVLIATVWFKRYYNLHQKTLALATELKEVDRSKDEFLANTSHELQNPLHSILNISEAILKREKNTLKQESIDDLELITTVSKRMSSILNDLLDVAAIESGSPKLETHPVSIKAVTSGVIDMVSYIADSKPIEIIDRVPEALPLVEGDENRLVQVMFNLLYNAIKYTDEGCIEVSAKDKDNFVYVSVKDTGAGMSEELMENIFDRYVQGSNADVIREGGFGIGLYISHQLIELHGGKLTVQSQVGKGTTFTFSLPIIHEASHQTMIQEKEAFVEEAAVTTLPLDIVEEAHNQQGSSDTDRPRIIVVDDEQVNLRVIEAVLSSRNYDITSVLSAEEALELLDEREWDLIISDVMMPKMSGYELTKEVRKRFSMLELPILIVTARRNPKDIETGFLVGANDYITKPIDAVELRSRVNALTSARQSMRERLRLESAWLQAQIKPHFMFNTVNSIIALSQIDIEKMREILTAFSDILQAKFNFENLNDLVPIDKEISVIKSYVYIEQIRFGDRLQFIFDIDESVHVLVPTLSIQPLVENAINHGVMSKEAGGTVALRVKEKGEWVEVTVEDDGVGIKEEILENIAQSVHTEEMGVGLINIDLRLKRLFGTEGLMIHSERDKGTTITFKVPK